MHFFVSSGRFLSFFSNVLAAESLQSFHMLYRCALLVAKEQLCTVLDLGSWILDLGPCADTMAYLHWTFNPILYIISNAEMHRGKRRGSEDCRSSRDDGRSRKDTPGALSKHRTTRLGALRFGPSPVAAPRKRPSAFICVFVAKAAHLVTTGIWENRRRTHPPFHPPGSTFVLLDVLKVPATPLYATRGCILAVSC